MAKQELESDLAEWGAPAHVRDQVDAAEDAEVISDVFEIAYENIPATDFFFTVQTQWTVAGLGSPTGLNYVAVESAMNMQAIARKSRPALFAAIRTIEGAVLSEWHRQRQKDQRNKT